MSKTKLINLIESKEVKSWRLLMAAFQCVYGQLEKGLGHNNVSVPRFQVLFHLYFEGSSSAIGLSRKLSVTRSNMSMFLKRMESDQLIKFDLLPGKKRPEIKLTIRGIKFFEELFPKHAGRIKGMVHPFSQETIEDLEKIKQRTGDFRQS